MRSIGRRPTRAALILTVVTAAGAGLLGITAPVAAQQAPAPVTGLATCDSQTGVPSIEWTITNNVFTMLTIDAATVSGAIDASATFSPNPIDPGGTARAVTSAPVGTTGAVSITVDAVWAEGELEYRVASVATATLGPCEAPPTSAPATTSTTTTAPPTVVTPTFTG